MSWKFEKIGDVCEVIAGQSPPSASYNNEAMGLPFFQGKTDFGEHYPSVRLWCNAPNKIAEANDVLLSVRAPVGPTNICNLQSCIGRGLAAIRSNGKTHYKYVYYYFKFIEEKLSNTGNGSTFSSITIGNVKDILIPIPDVSTQKKIAAILDKADELRRKDQQLLAKYDELLQSIFYQMFGDPVKNEKRWKKMKLSDCCLKITDGTHDTPERLTRGIKFITGKHIRPFKIDYSNSDYVTEEVHKEIYRRCDPKYGDVLYTNIGVNLATAAMNIVDYEFSMKNVALLKPNTKTLAGRYLEHCLNHPHYKNKVVSLTGMGGAQQFLSLSQIKLLQVPVPELSHQQKFAEIVEEVERQKSYTLELVKKSESLFQSLLQKAFKGELVN